MPRLLLILAIMTSFPLARLVAEDPKTVGSAIVRETREVNGWKVHINKELLDMHPGPTELALRLLEKQLAEIVKVVPGSAVAELRKVPLYFSPAYADSQGGAEFHPGVEWLKEHGRDPAMVKAVEFSNILTFEQETLRMPNFALHELAHAYHNLVLKEGFGNPQISEAFRRAKESGKYERVERWHGVADRTTFERAYAMSNPMEYFAETSEAYFSRNDFFPFTRSELKDHDPEMFELLTELWGVENKLAK
jgi:hypothetical protein